MTLSHTYNIMHVLVCFLNCAYKKLNNRLMGYTHQLKNKLEWKYILQDQRKYLPI